MKAAHKQHNHESMGHRLPATLQNGLMLQILIHNVSLAYHQFMKQNLLDNKSYDDSVKLKRTEMDPFRLGVREWSRTESRQSQREPVPAYID